MLEDIKKYYDFIKDSLSILFIKRLNILAA